MNELNFVYWLQGFVELSDDLERPSKAQWQAIKDHLQLVFDKVTPPVGKLPGLQVAPTPPVPTYPWPPSVEPLNPVRPLTDWTRPGMMPVITC